MDKKLLIKYFNEFNLTIDDIGIYSFGLKSYYPTHLPESIQIPIKLQGSSSFFRIYFDNMPLLYGVDNFNSLAYTDYLQEIELYIDRIYRFNLIKIRLNAYEDMF